MEYLASIFIVLIEYLILINISSIFAKPRCKKNLSLYIGIAYIVFGVCIFGILLKDFSRIKIFGALIYSGIACIILYECSAIKVFMVAMLHACVLFAMDYIAVFSLSAMTGKSIQDIMNNHIMFIEVAFVSKFLGFILTYYISQYFIWERSRERGLQFKWMLIAVFPLASIFAIFTLISVSLQYGVKSIELIFSIICLMISNIVALFVLNEVEKKQEIERDNVILKEQIKRQLEKTEILMNSYDQQRKLTHDFNNHLQVIMGLLKNKQYSNVEKYSSQLLKVAQANKFVVQTNNPLIDVLLNQKYFAAKNNNIVMRFDFNDLSEMLIEENDIVIILGNAIDNAIEGCTAEDKVIKVKILAGKENNIISVKNTTYHKPNVGGRIISTKTDELNHGYGIRNIKKTVEKYKNDFAIECESGWFQMTIVVYP